MRLSLSSLALSSAPALALVSGLTTLGCSKGGDAPAKQADGSYQLSCKGPLTDCLQRADRLCGDEGYTVAGARDVRELVGHEAGESQREIRKSDAVIYCGKPPAAEERRMIEIKRDRPITTSAPAAEKPRAAPLACVPGTTQSCVGPGGCSGGQACAADGSRYEACDCGAVSPPAAAAD